MNIDVHRYPKIINSSIEPKKHSATLLPRE